MKNAILCFLMVFCIKGLAFAQQEDNYRQDTTTLYQRAKGFSFDPIRSKWRQELKKEGELFVLTLYDKKDVIQERISFADKELLERKGSYVRYSDGRVKEEGNYDKGYKVGTWKRYHANKHLSETANYLWDKLAGSRKMYYNDGKLALDEVYNRNGNLELGKYFDKQGNAVDFEYMMKLLF
ncbi:MAG: toxin-antitoxin system YwqK family antitoxin [Bacteroidia bacterium]